ncbi:MAG: UbiA family prenyltransferase [Bacteroidetes bacterium]|nr:UbiA family prenyltransferase [Bacteroidota bacterium]
MTLIRCVIDYFENNKAPLGNFIASFLFFVLLRNFTEVYATHQDLYLMQTLTYSPFYIALACWLIFLICLFTKADVVKVSKMVFAFHAIILLPPIIDILFSTGSAVRMRYFSLSGWESLFKQYVMMGTGQNSMGQRIEVVIAVIGSFIYFFSKNNRWFLSGMYALAIYTCIFCFAIGLSLLNSFFQWLHIAHTPSQDYFFLARLYFISTAICVVLLFYLHNKEKFKMLLYDLRALRIIHYLLMVVLGFVLLRYRTPEQISVPLVITTESFFYFFLIPISIVFAAVFTIISNNVEDLAIDRISNPNRPLVSNRIAEKEYMIIGYIALALSLIASILVNRSCFIFMGLIIGNYYLYSNPPFKLKRIPVLSKLIVGINSAFMALMGYTVFGGAVLTFPPEFLFFLVVCLGLSSNFIDLKDYEGDKSFGIKTLPVLLGLRVSKMVISLFTVFSYVVFYFIIRNYISHLWLLTPMPLLLAAHLFYLNKKEFKEVPVFLIYLAGIIGVIIIMLADSFL